MRHYVINLDRRPDRMERMTRIAEALGIALTRVPAVDARAAATKARLDELPQDGPTGRMSDLTRSCTLSHFDVWRQFLADPAAGDHAVVLEDDVILHQDFPKVVAALAASNLGGFPLVKLEQGGAMRGGAFLGPQSPLCPGFGLRAAHQVLSDSAAYMLTRETARHLLDFSRTIPAPIDHFLFYPMRLPGFWGGPFAVVDPAPAVQDRAQGSDIASGRYLDSRKRRDRLRLVYEGRQILRILPRLLIGRARLVKVPFAGEGGG